MVSGEPVEQAYEMDDDATDLVRALSRISPSNAAR
jgi:hypothetical protein